MDGLTSSRLLTAEIAALRAGSRDVPGLAADTCARIEDVDPVVQAFVAEPGRRDRLQRQARSVAERWRDVAGRPPLFGIPVAVKDMVRVDGLPTRAGSALPPEVLGGVQASVIDRLRDAGALVAGKAVTAEFAVAAPGPTRNPHHPGHTPGGSSSGSAAAVAAGMVPLAIGTQTVGSVIRPAAYCGVVGFKPTHGRIPVSGVIANAPTYDTVGLFTSDVAGAALAAAVLCDGWRAVERSRRLPVLGVPAGPYLEHAGPEALAAFDRQIGRLRATGMTVRHIPVMDDFEELARQHYVVNRFEAARTHNEWFRRFGELYRPETVAVIRQGQTVDRGDYARALRRREHYRGQLETAMSEAGVDAWIAPSATGPAPSGVASTGSGVMCLPWSNAGMPSLTVPAGRASNGLPLGLQCVGSNGSDELLLDWAVPVEAAFPVIG